MSTIVLLRTCRSSSMPRPAHLVLEDVAEGADCQEGAIHPAHNLLRGGGASRRRCLVLCEDG